MGLLTITFVKDSFYVTPIKQQNEIQTRGLEPVFPFLTSDWNFFNYCTAKNNNVIYN